MLLTILSLWMPYEKIRDSSSFGIYIMIAVLFLVGQVQGYIQGWFNTGMTNMVHVITPNTQERTKIMSISGIIFSLGYTLNNLYFPIMVDILCDNGDKYNLRYFRGTYTPLALLAPFALLAYFGTKERLVLPKSRITKLSFIGSLRAVAGNKIFWIKCADGWNDFLEGAKGDMWDWMVYRAHIVKPTTFAVINTISYNAQFWAMLTSPWFIKKFGKKKIKIVKNILQIFLIAILGFTLESRFIPVILFIITTIDRFVDCGVVIDPAIESDMRDNQQYLIGERIDGSFGFVSSYMSGIIGAFTGLFIPWVYKKKGFDGTDYSVLDVYSNYNENLPLSAQTKNPNCVLYPMLKTLISISVVGAAIDVLPWFFYDISETGQKSMIRVIRIRTLVEDRFSELEDESTYLEGCEALMNARKYAGMEKVQVPAHSTVALARRLPKSNEEEAELRDSKIKEAKNAISEAETINEEIEIANFVDRELNRFNTEFGKKELELCRMIVENGVSHFYENAVDIINFAYSLPACTRKEEKQWRGQDIRNARALKRSARLAAKHFPNGIVEFDDEIYESAYNMPDETSEQAKIRRTALKKASKQRSIYANVASPYLYAKRIIGLYEGYNDIEALTAGYDDAVKRREEKFAAEAAEREKLNEERARDIERRKSEKKMKK